MSILSENSFTVVIYDIYMESNDSFTFWNSKSKILKAIPEFWTMFSAQETWCPSSKYSSPGCRSEQLKWPQNIIKPLLTLELHHMLYSKYDIFIILANTQITPYAVHLSCWCHFVEQEFAAWMSVTKLKICVWNFLHKY